ncbi:MAG: dihydroneopterin aldolase [Collinsella sp.]|nr:dihydroneopterin aldolase [Collinsella sp.]
MLEDRRLDEGNGDERGALVRREGTGLPVRSAAIRPVETDGAALADKVLIDGLEVFAHHGVYPEENKLGQKFIVSATIYCDLRRAGESDDLSCSIDYGAVCHDIQAFLTNNTFKLLERAATALSAHLLDRHPAMLGIRIRIEKPWAPVGLPLRAVGVEIERLR